MSFAKRPYLQKSYTSAKLLPKRVLSDAPPKNDDLGYDTLVKIDAASSLIKSIN